ncbi:MAG: oxygen-independent coproporphyrinogen III oxidase, partial [Lentisphaeria bacterium]
NRSEPRMPIATIVQTLRKYKITDINFDLIYGLPLQTSKTWQENLQNIIELKPSRVATFSYAHVPWAMPQQKKLEKFSLPSAEEKLSMLIDSMQTLKSANYQIIGMDHYALPNNPLAKAQQENSLHRNFQGYCTASHTGQVYAFGASAITQLNHAYSQNHRDISSYCEQIEKSQFACMRGYLLNHQEQICRDLINNIMCNSQINLENFAHNYNLTIEELLHISGYSDEKITPLIADKLISFDGKILEISERGKLVVRIIAMVFDPALQINNNQFSKTI